jgi:hypothetical protein
MLVESAEHLAIFIAGAADTQLLGQVTCGNVDIQNAVVVPRSLFPQMLRRLDEIRRNGSPSSPWPAFEAWRAVVSFLTSRCSKEFLSLFLRSHPDLLDRVAEPGLYLEAVPEVRLAIRLHDFGLLPDAARRRFVETVSNYAINGEDSDALSHEGIRGLFTYDESKALKANILGELLPRLSEVRREWESNASRERADEDMQGFMTLLDAIAEQFSEEEGVLQVVSEEREFAHEWISEHVQPQVTRAHRALAPIEAHATPTSGRSIFDDIDADEE